MSITTLNGVIAGMLPPQEIFKNGAAAAKAGVFYSPFYVTGTPAAAMAPAAGAG